jgi:hypothetical protein
MTIKSHQVSNEKIGNRGGWAIFTFVIIVATVIPLAAYVLSR